MLGSIWKVLGQDIKTLTDSVVKYFSKKEGIDIEAEKRCLNAGYHLEEIKDDEIKDVPQSIDKNWEKSLILTGNQAVALGAICPQNLPPLVVDARCHCRGVFYLA